MVFLHAVFFHEQVDVLSPLCVALVHLLIVLGALKSLGL